MRRYRASARSLAAWAITVLGVVGTSFMTDNTRRIRNSRGHGRKNCKDYLSRRDAGFRADRFRRLFGMPHKGSHVRAAFKWGMSKKITKLVATVVKIQSSQALTFWKGQKLTGFFHSQLFTSFTGHPWHSGSRASRRRPYCGCRSDRRCGGRSRRRGNDHRDEPGSRHYQGQMDLTMGYRNNIHHLHHFSNPKPTH